MAPLCGKTDLTNRVWVRSLGMILGRCQAPKTACERLGTRLSERVRHQNLLFSGLYVVATYFISKIRKLYKRLQDVLNNTCKDQIWFPSPKDGWTQAQKAQNNEFVENELENWVEMSWITNKVAQ